MTNSLFRRAASIVVFLLLWEGAVRFGLVDPFLLVAPSTIAVKLVELLGTGELEGHIASSMSRLLVGYSLSMITGVLLGAAMGWFRWADDFLDPVLELFRPVSPLALLPLAILWLGIGQTSKIFVIWYGCLFPVLLNTYAAVRSVPTSFVEAGRTLGAVQDEILRRIVFFHTLPAIFTGARISFGVGMIVIIASEMVAADRGLGYLILTAQQNFQTAELYVGIVTIALIGFVGDRIIRIIRARLCPWFVESEQS